MRGDRTHDLLDGKGLWSNAYIIIRYHGWCRRLRVEPLPISAQLGAFAERGWSCAVLDQIIAGIEHGDPACAWIGIELIEEDGGFVFGRLLKARAARALRRASLGEEQKGRIRARVLAMLQRGFLPHEFQQYAKLARRIGMAPATLEALGDHANAWTRWYARYLLSGDPGPKPRRARLRDDD